MNNSLDIETATRALAAHDIDLSPFTDRDRAVTVSLDERSNVARYYWHDEDGERFQEPFNVEALNDRDAGFLRDVLRELASNP